MKTNTKSKKRSLRAELNPALVELASQPCRACGDPVCICDPLTGLPPSTTMTTEDFVHDLFTRWCESAPYGEQVPREWPDLLAAVVQQHAGKDRDSMAALIMDGSPDASFERLLHSIFTVACSFTLQTLGNAIDSRDMAKLRLIGITSPA